MRISGALALVAALALGACSKPAAVAGPPGGTRTVRVATVELRPLAGGLETSGILVSREEAAVNAEQLLSGYRVAKVFVEANASVQPGPAAGAAGRHAAAGRRSPRPRPRSPSRRSPPTRPTQAKDVEGLDKQGVISQEQIDQRRFQARSAQAAVDAQTAALSDLQTREQRMVIRAPVSRPDPGAQRAAGRHRRPAATTPMFRMARDSLVELEAQVAEDDLAGIHVGERCAVTLPGGAVGQRRGAPDRARRVDPQTKLGEVRIPLPVRSESAPAASAAPSSPT